MATASIPARPRRRPSLVRLFGGNAAALVGAIVVAVIVLLAIFAPLVAPFDPEAINLRARMQPPSTAHWFGTDELGRDILSRVIHGARPSLMVGLVSVAMATIVGTLLGLIAGYAGGTADAIIMRLMDIIMSFPLLLLGDSTGTLADLANVFGWAFTVWGVALYWWGGILYGFQVRRLMTTTPRVART